MLFQLWVSEVTLYKKWKYRCPSYIGAEIIRLVWWRHDFCLCVLFLIVCDASVPGLIHVDTVGCVIRPVKTRPLCDPYGCWWDVKPYSTNHSLSFRTVSLSYCTTSATWSACASGSNILLIPKQVLYQQILDCMPLRVGYLRSRTLAL